jgi:hypothetical protein
MQELNKAIDDIWSKGELSNGITTRYAVPEDAKRLLEIYAPYVENTAITFEYDVPTLEEFIERNNSLLCIYTNGKEWIYNFIPWCR